MPGLVHLRGFVGPNLDAPGVRANGGDLLLLAPVAILEFDPGRIAAGKPAPTLLEAFLELPGSDDDEITAADRYILGARTCVKLGVRNAVAVRQTLHIFEAGDVEQDAAPDHFAA